MLLVRVLKLILVYWIKIHFREVDKDSYFGTFLSDILMLIIARCHFFQCLNYMLNLATSVDLNYFHTQMSNFGLGAKTGLNYKSTFYLKILFFLDNVP